MNLFWKEWSHFISASPWTQTPTFRMILRDCKGIPFSLLQFSCLLETLLLSGISSWPFHLWESRGKYRKGRIRGIKIWEGRWMRKGGKSKELRYRMPLWANQVSNWQLHTRLLTMNYDLILFFCLNNRSKSCINLCLTCCLDWYSSLFHGFYFNIFSIFQFFRIRN